MWEKELEAAIIAAVLAKRKILEITSTIIAMPLF